MVALAGARQNRRQEAPKATDHQQGFGTLQDREQRGRGRESQKQTEGQTRGNQDVDLEGEEGHQIQRGQAPTLKAQAKTGSQRALSKAQGDQRESDERGRGQPGFDRQ